MKLGMLQTADGLKFVGVTLDGRYVDLCAVDPKLPATLMDTLADPEGLAAAAGALAHGLSRGPYVTGQVVAPLPRPGKVLCIGLNYRDHAKESGSPIPDQPVVFSKFPQSVIGPDDTIRLPGVSHEVDYEAELVVVIGKRAKHVARAQAFQYVAGYLAGNDVSARDWQKGRPGGQWLLGKAPDTFAPLGPWLVTADEVGDPHNLRIQLRLNGQTMQDSTTKELIFGIDELIVHITQLITLEPGDVIYTGTPPGVGVARKPPVFLQPGDTVEVEIEHLGVLRNKVAADN